MKKAAIVMALLSMLCLSACTMIKAPMDLEDVEDYMGVMNVDELNINGIECGIEDGKDQFADLLLDLERQYEGKLYGGEMKFVVLYWYRNGKGGYICAPPGLTYHSDLLTIGFLGIAEFGIVTLKYDDANDSDLIGFSRYNGHGFCIIGTLENYEYVLDESGEDWTGILKEYSYMLGPFKLHTVREFLDWGGEGGLEE